MSRANRITWECALSLALAVVLLPGPSRAADDKSDKGANTSEKSATVTPDKSAAEIRQKTTIYLFDAMKRGDVDVKFVAKNSHDGRLLVKNNTDLPLSVKLPDAFAAVPVLAQAAAGGAGAGGGTRSNRSSNNQNNQNQSVGGGFGGGGGGYGGGGGAFDVAPEKVAKFKVEMVCLEHGKKEPTAAVAYEIEPITTYTNDPQVQELCKLVGSGEVSQQAAQAAAWHLANHMTWEQLIDKKTHHLLGGDEIYFSAADIRSAMQITDRAIKMAENHEPSAALSASAPDTAAKSAGK